MNNVIKRINDIIKQEIKINLPDIHDCDLEENGKIYYMNGRNGTIFDYNMNEKLSDFMCFYKDGSCGVVKLSIYSNGYVYVYLYKYGKNMPFYEKKLKNQFTEVEIFELAVILNKIMDESGIFDMAIDDYDFDVEITDDDKKIFLNDYEDIY